MGSAQRDRASFLCSAFPAAVRVSTAGVNRRCWSACGRQDSVHYHFAPIISVDPFLEPPYLKTRQLTCRQRPSTIPIGTAVRLAYSTC